MTEHQTPEQQDECTCGCGPNISACECDVPHGYSIDAIIDEGLGVYCETCGIRACGIPADEH